jgi:hypothetical protein
MAVHTKSETSIEQQKYLGSYRFRLSGFWQEKKHTAQNMPLCEGNEKEEGGRKIMCDAVKEYAQAEASLLATV